DIDALIIPGGESTTIGKLAERYGIIPKLRDRIAAGLPVWGTCAGAIFLAKDVPGHPHPILAAMDISVERNAFGRQQESFEADLDVKGIAGGPYHAVFIRSPKITRTGRDVETLAKLGDGTVAAARPGQRLALGLAGIGGGRLHVFLEEYRGQLRSAALVYDGKRPEWVILLLGAMGEQGGTDSAFRLLSGISAAAARAGMHRLFAAVPDET